MTDHQNKPPILEYQSPRQVDEEASGPELPQWLIALVLCTPGTICWALFLGAITGVNRPPPMGDDGMITLWGASVITAIISVLYFRKKPKPWYVFYNFVVNIAGLVFSAAIFAIGLVLAIAR